MGCHSVRERDPRVLKDTEGVEVGGGETDTEGVGPGLGRPDTRSNTNHAW